jgi:hypothetical protein
VLLESIYRTMANNVPVPGQTIEETAAAMKELHMAGFLSFKVDEDCNVVGYELTMPACG